jgi:hypothetical protein
VTWSIIARDEQTGRIGIIVASNFFSISAARAWVVHWAISAAVSRVYETFGGCKAGALAAAANCVAQCGYESRDGSNCETNKQINPPATTPVVLAIQSPSAGVRPALKYWPISRRAAAAARPITIMTDCRRER